MKIVLTVVLQFLEAAVENSHINVREIRRNTNISMRCVHLTSQIHKFHPFQIHLHQELQPQDIKTSHNFCNWANNKIAKDESYLIPVLF